MSSVPIFKLACGCAIRLAHPDPHLTHALGYDADNPLYREIQFIGQSGAVVRRLTGSADQGFIASPKLGFGPSPDDQYLSFLTVTRGSGSTSEEIRVVGGRSCDYSDYAVVSSLAPVKPSKFEGWAPSQPHAIVQNVTARIKTIALPRAEAERHR